MELPAKDEKWYVEDKRKRCCSTNSTGISLRLTSKSGRPPACEGHDDGDNPMQPNDRPDVDPQSQPSPKRPWQFSLRSLLTLMTAWAVLLSLARMLPQLPQSVVVFVAVWLGMFTFLLLAATMAASVERFGRWLFRRDGDVTRDRERGAEKGRKR